MDLLFPLFIFTAGNELLKVVPDPFWSDNCENVIRAKSLGGCI